MRMQSCRIATALFIVLNSVGATLALSASSTLLGTGAIERCGHADGLSISCRDDEAIQLRFAAAHDQSVLTIDFVLRGRNVPNEHRLVEVFLNSPQRSGRVPSRVTFQVERRLYPMSTTVDGGGVKSVLPLEDFVNLAMMSTLKGTAFGEDFVATEPQMLTLRLAAGRWAAYAPSAK